MGYSPRSDRVYPISSYALRGAGCHDSGDHLFYGAPRHIWMYKLENMLYMGIREVVLEGVWRHSLHDRPGRILVNGWTMLCKWGHPVATYPVTNVDLHHTRRMTEILRITWGRRRRLLSGASEPTIPPLTI
eukprot:6180214-Pleurochrysis_carterae.AAC.2